MTTPSFYAIIPANVRYCKQIEANAKLLYGEITALAQQEGYCWASNQYFAELYGVDERSIKNWMKSLKDQGFIDVELTKDGIQTKRKIWISPEIKKVFAAGKNLHPGGKKSSPPGEKIFPHSNTSNTTSNNPPPPSSPPDPLTPTEEEEEELERRFKERDPKAPRIKSRKAWDASVLRQIREEGSRVIQEDISQKKRLERVDRHLRQAEKHAFQEYKGFKVFIRNSYVEFRGPKGGFNVAYAVSDEEWERETGWSTRS